MSWKKLNLGGPGRPPKMGPAIVIYPNTGTMYASSALRGIGRVEFEINEERHLLRVTPSPDGIELGQGRFNFRQLRQLFDITKNTTIRLVKSDDHYIGRLDEGFHK